MVITITTMPMAPSTTATATMPTTPTQVALAAGIETIIPGTTRLARTSGQPTTDPATERKI